MAEREKEREKATAFSLLVSVDHSTSASIVFRASRHVNNPLNLVRKTPARNRKIFYRSDREVKPLETLR